MSNQRQPFVPSGSKAEAAQRHRVDATKPIHSSLKEQNLRRASKAATQAKVLTPDPISAIPIQSHSHPPDVTKKRAARTSQQDFPAKRPKAASKRSASLSNGLYGDPSSKTGHKSEENPDGTSSIYTNVNVVNYHVQDSAGQVSPVNEGVNQNNQIYLGNTSNDVRSTDSRIEPKSAKYVKLDVAYSLKPDDQAEIIDSEMPTGPSSPYSYEENIFTFEDDDMLGQEARSHSGQSANSPQNSPPTGPKTTQMLHKELASETCSFIADRSCVIDVDASGSGTSKDYNIPALFIAEMTTWAIPKATIPIDPASVSDWEDKGKELATRATKLMEAHINHRRERAALFGRVLGQVLGHKAYLEDRNKALTQKLKVVSSQCESLIEEVKSGTL